MAVTQSTSGRTYVAAVKETDGDSPKGYLSNIHFFSTVNLHRMVIAARPAGTRKFVAESVRFNMGDAYFKAGKYLAIHMTVKIDRLPHDPK